MLRFLGCVTVILILHCTGKNAILGKLKLTAVYLTGFRRSRKKMELKQLEYFTIVCEKGSFSQAAECLYTSQPNVSKVISSLEKELGRKLVERSSRGLRITPYGETVRDYAKVILKHASLISSMATHHNGKKFTLATYPSNMITNLLVDFYRHWGKEYIVEHQEGSVEEVSNWVASAQTEIGIVYIAQRQLAAFRHILGHKNLEFEPLDVKEACVYVGPNHPYYERDCVDFSELSSLRFIGAVRDYFSMEHHLDRVSLGAISTKDLNYSIYSNSDHMTINALMQTDLCSLGINFMHQPYKHYDIKNLKINGCEPFLLIGIVRPEGDELSEAAQWFIENFKKLL